MYNKELYKRLEARHGRENMINACDIISDMYEMLEQDRKERNIAVVEVEYGYEAEWWGKKYEALLYNIVGEDE